MKYMVSWVLLQALIGQNPLGGSAYWLTLIKIDRTANGYVPARTNLLPFNCRLYRSLQFCLADATPFTYFLCDNRHMFLYITDCKKEEITTVRGQLMENITNIKDNTANPAPLGLLGFGMTTVLLNLHNAGFFPLDTMILGMGIFYGGLAQIFAGIMEWKKKNTFGATAFTSYGLFWLTLVALLVLPKMGWGEGAGKAAMAAYLFMWGLFTALMFIGTLKLNRALQVVFASLTILFWMLALGDITGN